MKSVNFKDLNIKTFQKHLAEKDCFRLVGQEVFVGKDGVCVDLQSINLICSIYDRVNDVNKKKFDAVLCKDEYKMANFFSKMWGMVKGTKKAKLLIGGEER